MLQYPSRMSATEKLLVGQARSVKLKLVCTLFRCLKILRWRWSEPTTSLSVWRRASARATVLTLADRPEQNLLDQVRYSNNLSPWMENTKISSWISSWSFEGGPAKTLCSTWNNAHPNLAEKSCVLVVPQTTRTLQAAAEVHYEDETHHLRSSLHVLIQTWQCCLRPRSSLTAWITLSRASRGVRARLQRPQPLASPTAKTSTTSIKSERRDTHTQTTTWTITILCLLLKTWRASEIWITVLSRTTKTTSGTCRAVARTVDIITILLFNEDTWHILHEARAAIILTW